MRKKILLLLIICFIQLNAQSYHDNSMFNRDTSFTVYSAKDKIKKDFPNAVIVTPELSNDSDSSMNVVYSKLSNGNLYLDIFFPKEKLIKHPAVILIHGGGWHSGDRSNLNPLAQKLAGAGYVTASIEYRLSNEALYPAAVKDVKTAIKWIKENCEIYGVDSNKVAVLGSSAGGQLASLVGMTNNIRKFESDNTTFKSSSAVQAIVDIDGLLDFTSPESKEFDVDPNKPKAAHQWLGYSFKQNPEIWKEAGAYFYVNNKSVPILFINSSLPHYHAGRDSLAAKYKKFKIYYEIHTIKNTPHPFWLFHPWFDETYSIIKKYLDTIFKY